MNKKTLIAAGNVEAPALLVILQKGYSIEVVIHKENMTLTHYQATKDNYIFFATSFLQLLGLIALWENRGDEWKLTEDEFILVKDEIEKAETRAGLD